MSERTDAVVVGAGLAGLVAASELADAGRRVVIVDQESADHLGGQAFWSLGGLFMVDTPEQRRLGIRDSRELALQDWLGSAGFDREEDHWPRIVAEAYVDFAAGEMRSWLHAMGLRWFPVVGWAERGGSLATGHGNSVPRFHITWGTGPGVLAPFERRVRAHMAAGRIILNGRHRVSELRIVEGTATGVAGEILAPATTARGETSSRAVIGDFEIEAGAILLTADGVGGNHEMVRRNWPVARLGPAPQKMISGVPAHVDGRMLEIAEAAGGRVINRDRMWHYTEGVTNHD
ncbi:FAD-binding dehydrogenase, partial [Aurantimonas coralicida]